LTGATGIRTGRLPIAILASFIPVPSGKAGGCASSISGRGFDRSDLNCVAFRREVNRRYEGVGRKVVGMSCTSQDVEKAEEALKSLKAPGE
jgi:hypothetical protein